MKESAPKPAPEDEIARLAARAREGEAAGLEALLERAELGEEHAVEALFALLREGLSGALDAFVHLALKSKNLPARELLFEHLRSILREWAGGLLGNLPSERSDLAQSCIRRFLAREPDLANMSGLELLAYLRQMAANWTVDRHRERKRRRQVELAGHGTGRELDTIPSRQVRPPEEISDLDFEALISSLAPEEKDLIRMRFKEGLNYDEIGRRLNPPLSYHAVWMRLARILRRMRP